MSAGEHSQVITKEFSEEEADRFYNFFKPDVVSATGGEPLLNQKLVKALAKSTAKYGGALELVTNGLLLTKELVEELNALNKNTFYQISLDGSKEYHDHLRGKDGAYDGAMKAIDLCSASGRLTKVRMTVTAQNFEQVPIMIRNLDKFKRNNIILVMRPVVVSGRAIKNKLQFGNIPFSDLDKFKDLPQNIQIETTDNIGKCGCGIDTIAIDPKGDIYPCCYLVFNPKYKMGDMFNDFKNLQEHKEFVNFGGSCYARHIRK